MPVKNESYTDRWAEGGKGGRDWVGTGRLYCNLSFQDLLDKDFPCLSKMHRKADSRMGHKSRLMLLSLTNFPGNHRSNTVFLEQDSPF